MIEVGTILQNRYQVQQKIGAGGMGTVYLATDQRFDSPVAIKEALFTDDDLKKAFEREAQLLNRMRHPALPRVIDYFAEGDHQFLVMEYIAGADLSAILKQKGAFETAQVLRWADELLGALEYLHQQKPPVIHRDIKPQNLKLTTSGEIILLDFGLAKGKTGDTSRLSLTNSVFGYSRSYAPLEQIQGTGTDLRSDIYSLAATLYHLFTGKPPVDALTRATAYVNNETDPLLPVNKVNSQVPASVAEVLRHALELNAGLRLQSATEMRRALRAAADATAPDLSADDDDHEITRISGKAAKVSGAAAIPAAPPVVKPLAAEISETPIVQQSANGGNRIAAPFESSVAAQHLFDANAVEAPARKSWKKPLGIAAAIAILGGAAFAWYATTQPTASQSTNEIAPSNQSVNAAAAAPTNRKTETRDETAKTAANNSNNAATAATNANSGSSSASQTPNQPQTRTEPQVVESRRAEPAAPRSNQQTNQSSEETADNDAAADEQPTERPKAIEIPEPSPIIVKSAPPTNQKRKENRDDADKPQDENQQNNDEPPPAPKQRDKADDSNDEPPPAAPRRRRPDDNAESRQRRVNENRQQLPRILGAPR